jgi:hypothetical protein
MSRNPGAPVVRIPQPLKPLKSPYFWQDPIRISAMVCAGLLMYLDEIPWTLGLFAIGISQTNAIAMIIDIMGRGWSLKWGARTRSSVFTSCLALDWVNVSVCTLVGAMLLMRLFGPPALVVAVGWLTLAIALVPDIRVCRLMLPEDARRANQILSEGYFFRDPVKLGALAAMTVVCVLDRTSLAFVFVSMVMLQLNSLLIMVDKYLSEIEITRREARVPFRAVRLLANRDGQRLLLVLLPLAFVPLRLGTPDQACRYVAAAVAALIIVPDVCRMLWRLTALVFGFGFHAKPARAQA